MCRLPPVLGYWLAVALSGGGLLWPFCSSWVECEEPTSSHWETSSTLMETRSDLGFQLQSGQGSWARDGAALPPSHLVSALAWNLIFHSVALSTL